MKKKDEIFKDGKKAPNPFEFNETVAVCFDDMVKRSVPLYNQTIDIQTELAAKFYRKETVIYDLGCSNGNFGISFLEKMKGKSFKMVGVDNSSAMIDIYSKRLASRKKSHGINLVNKDINELELNNASVVVMNLALQFIQPELRDNLVKKIYESLCNGGIFLLTEKVSNENSAFTDTETAIYYDFKKKNGYSELEINRKREALDNVLISETSKTHIKRLLGSGFSYADIYLKWFQFTSFIAEK
ncbi:MAG: carboxy-S-adenosyl-L-methionine synthase CmoA [Deltaproteobacteria bacterium]|nr:MAG: carboxy-S-adenosyl-L-methionine synthase CmoA [Deltaproteobacteria bacterium]PIE74986.1 MAG: carboxy-S-adenosyl-L-methionine synthase CmoA [Deltaproteobacteria bacterium]